MRSRPDTHLCPWVDAVVSRATGAVVGRGDGRVPAPGALAAVLNQRRAHQGRVAIHCRTQAMQKEVV